MPRSTMMSAVMMKTVLLTIRCFCFFSAAAAAVTGAGGKLYAVNLKPQRHMKGVRLGQNLSPQPCP